MAVICAQYSTGVLEEIEAEAAPSAPELSPGVGGGLEPPGVDGGCSGSMHGRPSVGH